MPRRPVDVNRAGKGKPMVTSSPGDLLKIVDSTKVEELLTWGNWSVVDSFDEDVLETASTESAVVAEPATERRSQTPRTWEPSRDRKVLHHHVVVRRRRFVLMRAAESRVGELKETIATQEASLGAEFEARAAAEHKLAAEKKRADEEAKRADLLEAEYERVNALLRECQSSRRRLEEDLGKVRAEIGKGGMEKILGKREG